MEIAIIGGGPAGLTAAIYALRAGCEACLFEKGGIGGQAAITNEIENYPSHININGWELTDKMREQAVSLGLKILHEDVLEVKKLGKGKFEITTSKGKHNAVSVVLAMGATHKTLGVEQDYIGRGVSYCATCDGNFYRGSDVAVVGGGNTAVGDALYLSKLANKVYLIHRRNEFRANKILSERLRSASNIELVLESQITSLNGKNGLESISVLSNNGSKREIAVEGLFIAVGQQPQTACVEKLLKLDGGYINSGENTRTRIKGLYVAGDCRVKPLRQVITACADGAVAGEEAAQYVQECAS